MVELAGIALLLVGLVVLFAGAALSVYGVAILGIIVGGSGGFTFAPTIGDLIGLDGILAVVAATVLGAVVGVAISYLLLSFAVAALSFVVGTYAGLVIATPLLGDGAGLLVYPAALVVGVVAAALGSIMTKTTMVLVTSFVGATLASGSLTLSDVTAVQDTLAIEPLLFDLGSPIFLGLFALGVLTQFGLFKFGYVTKLVSVLPGARAFRDRGDGTADR